MPGVPAIPKNRRFSVGAPPSNAAAPKVAEIGKDDAGALRKLPAYPIHASIRQPVRLIGSVEKPRKCAGSPVLPECGILKVMVSASRLVRSFFVGVIAAGLFGSGVCSPLLKSNCAIAGEISVGKKRCCCGDNCRCGPSCGKSSQDENDKRPSTGIERDHRDLGKIDSSCARFIQDFVRGWPLVDSRSFGSDPVGPPQTLLAQHTSLRV